MQPEMIAPIEDSPLRKWRRRHDLTLLALAERLGTTEATVSRVETGANPPSRDLELKIVNITSLSRDDILQPWLERQSMKKARAGAKSAGADA